MYELIQVSEQSYYIQSPAELPAAESVQSGSTPRPGHA